VATWHGTFMINSLAHVHGRQRYVTGDESRNNWWLALITLGEGWHNNHHWYQGSTRQGFRWWEIDVTFYVLKALSWVGVVRDLKSPPAEVVRGEKLLPRALRRGASRASGSDVRPHAVARRHRRAGADLARPAPRPATAALRERGLSR
jgi:stearoyl-CoA desaturase (delta-9 desaturase)